MLLRITINAGHLFIKNRVLYLQYKILTPKMGVKYYVNAKFFDNWSSRMAYVLGYWYADGSLENTPYNRGKYIRVTSAERHIIFKIRRWLSSKHNITVARPTWPNGESCYVLRIGSHTLYDALTDHGLYPKKSLTITFPDIPKDYLNDFIRGYLDGDGCVYLQLTRGKTKKKIVKKLSVIFTSGSRVFLQQLSSLLKRVLGVRQNKIYNGHRSFQLRYFTADSILIFKFLYKDVLHELYFKRKAKIFLKYFKLRPSKIDQDIINILKHLNSGHVVK